MATEMNKENKTQVSSCCGAEMFVASDTEGTSYFVCTKCREACDPGGVNEAVTTKAPLYVCPVYLGAPVYGQFYNLPGAGSTDDPLITECRSCKMNKKTNHKTIVVLAIIVTMAVFVLNGKDTEALGLFILLIFYL